MELLHQEYGGKAAVNIALFKPESSYTEDQTDDAVNEVQHIVAEYDAFDEEQVGRFLLFLFDTFHILLTRSLSRGI